MLLKIIPSSKKSLFFFFRRSYHDRWIIITLANKNNNILVTSDSVKASVRPTTNPLMAIVASPAKLRRSPEENKVYLNTQFLFGTYRRLIILMKERISVQRKCICYTFSALSIPPSNILKNRNVLQSNKSNITNKTGTYWTSNKTNITTDY